MHCVYVATGLLRIGDRVYSGPADGPIKGIESSPGFRVHVAQGLVVPMFPAPDGSLHAAAYAVTRACKLGDRVLEVGDVVPDAHLLPTFHSLVATHFLVATDPVSAAPPDPPTKATKIRTSWAR